MADDHDRNGPFGGETELARTYMEIGKKFLEEKADIKS